MTVFNVIKRNGDQVPFDVEKIRIAIAQGIRDLGKELRTDYLHGIKLEANFLGTIPENIKTEEIQKRLIDACLRLATPEEPHWRYVAANLLINDHNHRLAKERSIGGTKKHKSPYDNCHYELFHKLTMGTYDQKSLTSFESQEIIDLAQNIIKPEYDFLYDYAGAELLLNRYLMPGEAIQEAYFMIALTLASQEQNEELRNAKVEAYYEVIASKQISLATPMLANLRKPRPTLSSCYVSVVQDNLEDIFKQVTNTAIISKAGGGLAICFSEIRAKGAPVNGRLNSSGGVVPWVKIINDTAIAVNQGGLRSGAVSVALDIWHLDILDFLEIQKEHGDQRQKCFDVFPQVVIPDEFMIRVINNQDWYLVDPYEVKEKLGLDLPRAWGNSFIEAYNKILRNLKDLTRVKEIKARELFKEIMRSQLETGMPYLAFKDTINRANPNKYSGYIPCVNLCTESFSNVDPGETIHCCNLISINLATLAVKHQKNPELSLNELFRDPVRIAVEILDLSIDLNVIGDYVPEAKNHNDKYRTIGVGVLGLADWIALKGTNDYKTDGYGLDPVFEAITYHGIKRSNELAQEKGTFGAFDQSTWNVDEVMIEPKELDEEPLEIVVPHSNLPAIKLPFGAYYDIPEEHLSLPLELWQELEDEVVKYGIRNSQIFAIAPNSSTSIIQGCTASYLPTFKKFFINKGYTTSLIAPPFIDQAFWHYTENQNLWQDHIVDITSVIQSWVDTGVSMELIFNLNKGIYPEKDGDEINILDIYSTLIKAWEKGCKTVYYVRSIQKQELNISQECVACAN